MRPGGLLVPLLAAACVSCSGCREKHPYVPYAIGASDAATRPGDASLDAPSGATAFAADGEAPLFGGKPATAAPPGASQWTLDGAELDAPTGSVFVSGVLLDLEAGREREAFAIVRPADEAAPGSLAFYRGAAPSLGPPVLVNAPATLAHDASCTPAERLTHVGQRTVLVELGWQCPQHTNRAPVRWAAVVRGDDAPKLLLAATISDPAGAPNLAVEADTSDRDGDGRDDIALRVSLEGGDAPLEPGPRVAATLVWLDRPAGLSVDESAIDASFASLASAGASRAARAAEAPQVPPYVAQVRALWRAVCADGGAARLEAVAGAGAIRCGAARALEELGLAEARAYVSEGDAVRAALAIDRAERPPAAHTASRVKEARAWLSPLARTATARILRSVAAVPASSRGHEPTWGPLAFDATGKLLVRTRAGVARVDADQGDEVAASDVAPWPAAVSSPDGTVRWIETYDPCDGSPLRATFEPVSGDDVNDVALPVMPRLGGRCAGSRGAPADSVPVAWGPAGLEAMVEDELLLVAPDRSRASSLASFVDQPFTRGAPRSPDGRTYVVATGSGLLVRGPAKARLLHASELDGTYAEQQNCAVSDDATHVACVHVGRVWVGTWDAP